jgi:hypothetical protein
MNSTFYTATIPLSAPVLIHVPGGLSSYPRPRVVTEEAEQQMEDITLVELDCAFWIAPVTQTIHAQIAYVPVPVLIYGPADFPHVVTDTTEHHAARLLQVLGSDPAAVLQACVNRQPLPLPARVPREIAAWRAKAVIEMAGLLPQVEALIASVTNEAAVIVRRAWNDGAALQRNGNTVLAISAALNLSPEQLDAMFIQAAALEV